MCIRDRVSTQSTWDSEVSSSLLAEKFGNEAQKRSKLLKLFAQTFIELYMNPAHKYILELRQCKPNIDFLDYPDISISQKEIDKYLSLFQIQVPEIFKEEKYKKFFLNITKRSCQQVSQLQNCMRNIFDSLTSINTEFQTKILPNIPPTQFLRFLRSISEGEEKFEVSFRSNLLLDSSSDDLKNENIFSSPQNYADNDSDDNEPDEIDPNNN
eukprot:TRINITY_DN50947_c0_g1_i2.p1 TRINITY_DN50947_c0_g1~~TRINITY_DN50947_c0_g1_i2.p1  ORF type:complete len:212 (+),score=49.70 TRINITY_DN50947_c0_g1_i2:146-781(+)